MAQDKDLFGREGQLTEDFFDALRDAIVSAYPGQSREFFYLRLRNKWGVVVSDDITSLDQPGRIVVDRIVHFAGTSGRGLDLLALVWTDKPGNPKLRELAELWLPDLVGVLAKYGSPLEVSKLHDVVSRRSPLVDLDEFLAELQSPNVPASTLASPEPEEAAKPVLQKVLLRRSRLVDMDLFHAKFQQLKGALCRIGTPDVQGSGFLVGKQTVLTNYHVVEGAICKNLTGDQIICEFDYVGDRATAVTYQGADGQSWLIDKAKYSDSDETGIGDPAEGELDFAVIRLAQPVEVTRPSLVWPQVAPVVSVRDFVVIGQHPEGEGRKVAFGEVVEYPGSGLRYRYDVTTKRGSSGSPVLDIELNLVALHHAADPKAHPVYNQGVPIARVKAALIAAKHDLAAF